MKDIPNNTFNLTLTDIPYGVVNRPSGGLRNLDKENADTIDFEIPDLVKELVRVTSGSIYVWCSTEQVSELRGEFVKAGLSTRLGIWEKTNPSPMNSQYLWMSSIETCVYAKKPKATFNTKYASPVWRYPTVRSKRHPTEKSLELFKHLVEISSNEHDFVFDPFSGSGTTLEAAACQNRNYYGIDLDPKYVKVAQERLQQSATLW